MAVPKKKTSSSKKRMRRSHHALEKVNVVMDKNTGEYRLPHHMCQVHNNYNGNKVLVSSSGKTE